MTATGIKDGKRIVLGVEVGNLQSEVNRRSFLSSLKEPGFHGVEMVTRTTVTALKVLQRPNCTSGKGPENRSLTWLWAPSIIENAGGDTEVACVDRFPANLQKKGDRADIEPSANRPPPFPFPGRGSRRNRRKLILAYHAFL